MIQPASRRSRGLLVLAGAALAIASVGAAIERSDLFPRLQFAIQRDVRRLPTTPAVDTREFLSGGLPTLVVAVEPKALETLLQNKMEHGREWERRASVSYFDAGRLLFAGEAGIRVHGGGSRITSPLQSWRLFFRRQYGTLHFAPGVLFGSHVDPLKRLVVHNDVRRDSDGTVWHLANPLAYDFARRIGCITPETKASRFYLNGRYQGVYVLTEHFDDEYFEAHMPGRRITMELEAMEELRRRLDAIRPLTMDAVAALVDLDNMTSWFLAVVFAATRDAYQGPGQFLDEDRERAGWFWVTWDLDQSFRDWDLDSFLYLLERIGERPRGRRASEPRAFVLTTLIAEDPKFREYLARRIDTMLNHQLTPEFIEERRAFYEVTASRFGIKERDYLQRQKDFLARRPAFVRAIAEQWLNTEPGVSVTVRRDGGGPLLVDGFAKKDSFSGTFFRGRELVVRVADGRARWFVNGTFTSEGEEIRVTADRPMTVTAVLRGGTLALGRPGDELREAPLPKPSAIEWRSIPSGEFLAGCTEGDGLCQSNERPQRTVALDREFELMATEATVDQYAAFAERTGRRLPRQPYWSGPKHPVVNITFEEAEAFCTAAGGRLPTEVEWEFAARGGRAHGAYTTGETLDRGAVNGQGTYDGDRFGLTAPVASFPPGAFGLLDMTGNVWEWTSSWYREDADWTEPRVDAPSPSSPLYLKTVRGGSWDSTPPNLRVSRRVGLSPAARHNLYVGIRCAR